jgi:hypothetical protein
MDDFLGKSLGLGLIGLECLSVIHMLGSCAISTITVEVKRKGREDPYKVLG